MRTIDRIIGARVEGHDGTVDVAMADGVVTDITPSAPGAFGFDVGGCVVVPAFVDAHVHLDKAFLLHDAERDCAVAPRLDAAIAAVDTLRKQVTLEAVGDNARHALDTLVRHGVIAARVHVEVEPKGGLDLLALHLELQEEARDRCTLQLVAFPQLGLDRPGALDLLAAAMTQGATVVGGCPYVDDDPAAHLDAVFALAEQHGAPVDLHLDFTDDPARSQLGLVAERTVALGMQGRVTVGHVTTLAGMSRDRQALAFELLATAGVALVVVPATDLYLGGHGDPGTRSLAPLERAADAGVVVAIGNNNIANPFAPFGNGSLVQAAWLAGITRRINDERGRRLLLDAITTYPAAILGGPDHGPACGAAADLVVLDTHDASVAISAAPAVLATIRRGRLVAG